MESDLSTSETVEITAAEKRLRLNAIAFLQRRHVGAMTFDGHAAIRGEGATCAKPMWMIIVQDWRAGVKYRAIAMLDIDDSVDPSVLASELPQLFVDLDKNVDFHVNDGKRPSIVSADMPLVGRLVIYTNRFLAERATWVQELRAAGLVIDVVEEVELFKSVFISYGGPDAKAAAAINGELVALGVKTGFFPKDALPGQKLHRVMSTGVSDHDRVLLICSKASLSRPGVLNELERVLEREAAEGGSEILLPISLDDWVYGDWAPERRDLAGQLRSRVIGRFPVAMKGAAFRDAIEKVLTALKLPGQS